MNSKKLVLSNLKAAVIDREAAKAVVGGYYCGWAGGGSISCSGSAQPCPIVYVGSIPCLVCSLAQASGAITCKP